MKTKRDNLIVARKYIESTDSLCFKRTLNDQLNFLVFYIETIARPRPISCAPNYDLFYFKVFSFSVFLFAFFSFCKHLKDFLSNFFLLIPKMIFGLTRLQVGVCSISISYIDKQPDGWLKIYAAFGIVSVSLILMKDMLYKG